MDRLYSLFLVMREDSCQLFCQVFNNSRTSYFKLRDKVEDGTTCGPDSYDICVNGKCRMAGCDYVLNSTAKAGKGCDYMVINF